LTGSAFAAEAPRSQTNAVPAKQNGVTTETKPGGFALVTLGTWQTPELRNPIASRVAATGQLTKVRPNDLSSTSFRRAIYLPHVTSAEQQYALPPGLLDALIWTESRYNPLALSKAGAVGLGQLMSDTARAVGVRNRYDPRANLGGSARYLRQMLTSSGWCISQLLPTMLGRALLSEQAASPGTVKRRSMSAMCCAVGTFERRDVVSSSRLRATGLLICGKRGLLLTTIDASTWIIETENQVTDLLGSTVVVEGTVTGIDRVKADWIGQPDSG
jgi:hypothetical protein